jgi:serine protease Do
MQTVKNCIHLKSWTSHLKKKRGGGKSLSIFRIKSKILKTMKKLISLAVLVVFLQSQMLAQDFSELYEKVLPTVVKIMTGEEHVDSESGYVALETGLGSGVLIDEEGHILTAAHVVQTAKKVIVEFADGKSFLAEVVYSVPMADVALIKTIYKPKGRPFAKLGDSDKIKIGNQILMVGSPYGLEYSLSVGYISGRHVQQRFTNGAKWIEYLQTDASINKGNSGGPMFNTEGEVVGIASYILSESGGFQGLGFAATINVCKTLLLSGKNPWTGLEAKILTGEIASLLNLPQEAGLLVQKVVPLSPADMMGLKGGQYEMEIEDETVLLGGDIILEVNGIEIKNDASLEKILLNLQKARTIKAKVLRAGEIVELEGDI